MKLKFKTIILPIVILLILSVVVTAHIKPSPLNPRDIHKSYKEAESSLCETPIDGIMWNIGETYTIEVKSCNGVFIGVIHAITTDMRPYDGAKLWGIYKNGNWISYLNKQHAENIIYGNYAEVVIDGETKNAWDSYTPNGGYTGIWGYYHNVFT
jgi:hypothetical protein